jgi:hypothetical protein
VLLQEAGHRQEHLLEALILVDRPVIDEEVVFEVVAADVEVAHAGRELLGDRQVLTLRDAGGRLEPRTRVMRAGDRELAEQPRVGDARHPARIRIVGAGGDEEQEREPAHSPDTTASSR